MLTGQAFAFIGGPEHNAFAKAKGAELRDGRALRRSRQRLFLRRKGLEPNGRDFASLINGKTIATGGFGGTPEFDHPLPAEEWGLDAKNDVTLVETANSAILAAVQRQAGRDRLLHRAVPHAGRQAERLERAVLQRAEGARALRLLDHQHPLNSIKKEPEVVRDFVAAW